MVTFRNNNNNNSNRRGGFRRNSRSFKTNGDKILCEYYLQHADHFTRILNERESYRKEKLTESISVNNSDAEVSNVENSNQNSDKDLVQNSTDESKIQNSLKSQVEIN